MDFRFVHAIDAPQELVARALLSEAALARLPEFVPQLAEAREVSRREVAPGVVERAGRFVPSVALPAFARGVSAERLTWVERMTWQEQACTGTFAIEPAIPPAWREAFEARGSYVLRARGADRTERVAEGTVRIAVPWGRALLERYARAQLERHYAGEAQWLAAMAGARGDVHTVR